LLPLGLAAALPALTGARGDGCAANSRSPAPDVEGWWDIEYDDRLGVQVNLGGSVYDADLPAEGGTVTITHQGRPISFELDCSRADVVCPSEAWPREVFAEQRNDELEHRMIVTLPTQSCSGALVAPDPAECGEGTLNPDCEQVCDGEVTTRNEERFGVIGEDGSSFRLYLGAGIATNGVNCALLGVSLADADLETTGRGTEDWQATGMTNGLVTVAFAGGCLWIGDPDMDADLEAPVIGASVTFTTGFTGTRRDVF
jgi:hypothetical protein